MVIVEVQDSAISMLLNKGQFLGWVGDLRYYVLDGEAWCVRHGLVYRSEDQEESEQIIRQVRDLNNQ